VGVDFENSRATGRILLLPLNYVFDVWKLRLFGSLIFYVKLTLSKEILTVIASRRTSALSEFMLQSFKLNFLIL